MQDITQIIIIIVVIVICAVIGGSLWWSRRKKPIIIDWFTDRQRIPHWASLNTQPCPLYLRWKIQLPGPVHSSPIGQSSSLYIGCDDKKLYALNADNGSELWHFPTEGKVSSAATEIVTKMKGSSATTADLFITSEDGKLYSIDPTNGLERWHVNGGVGPFISSTNYASGLVFYVFQSTGVSSTLRAVDGTTGTVKWELPVGNVSSATPMHAFGGVYVGIAQVGKNYLRVKDDTGLEECAYSDTGAGAGCYTSGVAHYDVGVGKTAMVIISTRDRIVRALDVYDFEKEIWETTLEGNGEITGFALTQDREQNFLVVSQLSDLYALDPDTGTAQWRYTFPSNSSQNRKSPRPAIWGDHVFHVTGEGKLVAVQLADGVESWSYDLDAPTFSSPTLGGDMVFIATSTGSVYAFSCTELPDVTIQIVKPEISVMKDND